jgi:SulP family sulfate permease
MMERIGIIPDLMPREQIFGTLDECIKWIKAKS